MSTPQRELRVGTINGQLCVWSTWHTTEPEQQRVKSAYIELFGLTPHQIDLVIVRVGNPLRFTALLPAVDADNRSLGASDAVSLLVSKLTSLNLCAAVSTL